MSASRIAVGVVREALPVLALSAVGGLLAGVVLGGMRAELRDVPGLLVLVPALLAIRGNVYGSLGSRISTGLHQGLFDPAIRGADDRLWRAVTAALTAGLLMSATAAVIGYVALVHLGLRRAPLSRLLAIAIVAGLLSGIVLTIVVVSVVMLGYRRGVNPDTLVGPVVTTTGDVFGMTFLLVAVRVVLAVGGG